MNNLEEVKKILDEAVTCEDGRSHYIDENNKRYVSSLICQLFETKPDGDRLLTPEQMAEELNKLGGDATYKNGLKAIAKAQLAQDFTFEQARVERLFQEIEGMLFNLSGEGNLLLANNPTYNRMVNKWQALKERELGKGEHGRLTI